MPTYALLLAPSANRVYTDSAATLTLSELAVLDATVLGGQVRDIEVTTLGSVPYVMFEADALDARGVAYLSNASSLYALFGVEGELLRPLTLTPLDRFDDDLITIQKYAGKTNEHFTKLLLNVTLLATASAGELLDRRLRVLDPLCGRGTTLHQALMYGYDAAGIDLDAKDYEAYTSFVQTYLKRKRLKHRIESGPVRREKRVVARRLVATLAADKDRYRAGETQTLDVVQADTTEAAAFFKPATFDAIVTDAPYGVQHGSRTIAAGLRRGPLELLEEAVPVWARLLRPGGAMGIAWNTLVAKRDEVADILEAAGLAVRGAPWDGFAHRVDQSILRDVIVASKPLT